MLQQCSKKFRKAFHGREKLNGWSTQSNNIMYKGFIFQKSREAFFCTVIELVDVHNLMEIVFPLLKSFLKWVLGLWRLFLSQNTCWPTSVFKWLTLTLTFSTGVLHCLAVPFSMFFSLVWPRHAGMYMASQLFCLTFVSHFATVAINLTQAQSANFIGNIKTS